MLRDVLGLTVAAHRDAGGELADALRPERVDRVEALRRLDHARRDRVRGDPVRAELDRERADEPHEPRLRRRVVRVARPALVGARNRARREQPAPAGLDHVRHRRAETAEDAVQVDLEKRVPPFVVELRRRDVAGYRCVRDDDIEPAQLLDRPRDQGIDRARVGDVHLADDATASGCLDRRPRGFDVVRVRRVPAGDDVRAGLREDACRRGADPGRGAGDEGDSAVQPEHVSARAARRRRRRVRCLHRGSA